jgi:4'-phosphopantetheinyl transferase
MPIVYRANIHPKGNLGIWKITEPEAYFIEHLILDESEMEQLNRIKGFRRLQWLAGRMLIHLFSERKLRGAVLKDAYGKPHLIESTWEISISHTDKYAAVLAAPFAIGVDVQKIDPRMQKVAHKFLHPDEMEFLKNTNDSILKLHVLWGIKESMYKIYSKGALSWTSNFRVESFDYKAESPGQLKCSVFDGINQHTFAGHYFLFDNEVMLTYVQAIH